MYVFLSQLFSKHPLVADANSVLHEISALYTFVSSLQTDILYDAMLLYLL